MKFSWKVIILWTLPALLVGFFFWQGAFNGIGYMGNTATSRMTYGRFLEYLDSNRVDTVDFYEGGRTAIIEVVDPELNDRVQRVRVELPPNSPELVSKLKKKGISFDAHPVRNDGAIWGLLGNLIFPILLITGLFFYSVAQTVCLVVLVKQ